ncbi:hypothetical protein COO60DRAFT_1624699 [Scenedesmus sp. NREL 46B-D3]|nr:hypothetical protein COO60DRAFT_1624699 [Scenedesmus sp. NREL 46B-D3]
MPHQRELKELMPAGSEALQASLDEVGRHRKQAPGKGWLLVWTGTAGGSAAQPFPSSATPNAAAPEQATWVVDTSQGPAAGRAGGSAVGARPAARPAAAGGGGSSATLMFPGGPSCTLMAWPSRGGGSWSGCVFTAPQVFESLRSQADYEGLLRGLRAAGGSGSALPGLVLAPWLPPPPHLAAPSAGLLLLAPAAALTSSPQMLCPAASLGLQDAAVLAAAVAAALPKKCAGSDLLVAGGGGGGGGVELHRHVEQALKHFDKMRQPEVAALQHLQAQLSYLRHPFTPAAPAALAAIPPASLPWLAGLFGKAKAGLALQWKCLAAVLPLVAAVLKAAYSDDSSSSRRMRSFLASACLLLALGVLSADAQWMNGVALFSFGPEDNDPSLPYPKSLPDASCGYGELTEKEFPGFKLAAVSPKSELKGRAMGGCGTCVEIKCTDKQYCSATTPTQVVMVYDTCDECAAKELNVNARVFGELAPLSMGRIDVQYRQPCIWGVCDTACAADTPAQHEGTCGGLPLQGQHRCAVSDYRTAAGGWIRLGVRNVAGDGDITMVELSKAGSGSWIRMKNTYGSNWELSKLPSAPLDLRVTTKSGKSVVLSSAVKTPGATGTFTTAAQFKA